MVRVTKIHNRISIVRAISYSLEGIYYILAVDNKEEDIIKRRQYNIIPFGGLINVKDVGLLTRFNYLGNKIFSISLLKNDNGNYLQIEFFI